MTEQQTPGYPPATTWPPVATRAPVPGTVQAAAIVTYVCAGITTALTLFFALGALFVGSIIISSFQGTDRVALAFFVLSGVLVSLGLSACACLLAWQTTQRKSWARYGLAACSGVAAVLSLLSFSPAIVIGVPGGIAVLVLLFVPSTNDWFRDAAGDSP